MSGNSSVPRTAGPTWASPWTSLSVAVVRNAGGVDVRSCSEANDPGVRAARSRSLRHQELERAKRGLKPHPGAIFVLEKLLVGDDFRWIRVALCKGEHHRSDGLGRSSAPGPGYASDGDGHVSLRRCEGAASHCPRRRYADRAERFDHVEADMKFADFRCV